MPVRRRLLTGGAVGLALAGSAGIGLVAVAGAGRHVDRAAAQTPTPSTSAARSVTPLQSLTRLDALRSRAYATRNPATLAAVYRSAALLTADRAQLGRSVPVGCSLTGLHTSYRGISSARRAQSLIVHVTVTVGAATLKCKNSVAAVAASAPQRLIIELVGTGSDVRIAAEQGAG